MPSSVLNVTRRSRTERTAPRPGTVLTPLPPAPGALLAKSSTGRSLTPTSLLSVLRLRIEGVAQTVTEEIDGQHRHQQGEAGEVDQVRLRRSHRALGLVQH